MKITKVEAIPLEAKLEKVVHRARQPIPFTARRALLVRIQTDEGLVGLGEGLTPVAPWAGAEIVARLLSQLLIGRDPMDTNLIWKNLYEINSSRGYLRGYQMIAIAAVDMALWDLKGKILGQPVYKLLGGAMRESVPVYATGLMLEKDPSAIVDLAREYVERGLRGMKLKIGENVAQDLATARALREGLGPDIKLMVDANGGYDFKTALRVAKQLEPLDIFWFEEPLKVEDPDGVAELRRRIPMYLAAGECEYTTTSFRDLLLKGALDVCQPDVSRAGGITETRRIADLADTFNTYYAPHAWGGILCVTASIHLSMAMPNFLICELDQVTNPLRDELATEPLDFRDGCLHVPDKPGLGVELDPDAMERFRA